MTVRRGEYGGPYTERHSGIVKTTTGRLAIKLGVQRKEGGLPTVLKHKPPVCLEKINGGKKFSSLRLVKKGLDGKRYQRRVGLGNF